MNITNAKQRAYRAGQTSKRVSTSFEQMVQALSLTAVVGFGYYGYFRVAMPEACALGLLAASAIISIRAAIEWIRFLDK